jgi:hypothetical protein
MRRFGLIGISALSLLLALAATASAQDRYTLRARHVAHRAIPPITADGDPNLPVENALRWGYSQGYSAYPSGFGGLYGDGRYPDNTISSSRYNTLH